MKNYFKIALLFSLMFCYFQRTLPVSFFRNGETAFYSYNTHSIRDSSFINIMKPKPLRAAAEIVGINLGVWAFDRYVLNGDYARISLESIRRNFQTGFVWDNDGFDTNLFFHPYHGNLYFNAARSCNVGFWGAIPYTAVGSLMWEFLLESEPAAINDWLATTIGGVALGEVTWRLSNLFVNEQKQGAKRVFRELGIWVVSPLHGFNRLISGRAWKYCKSQTNEYHPEFNFRLSANYRLLCESDDWGENAQGVELQTLFEYGNPFCSTSHLPYSYFTLELEMNLMKKQPIIGGFRCDGILQKFYSKSEGKNRILIGLFQHFNFVNSDAMSLKERIVPYRISEAATLGIGLISHCSSKNNQFRMEGIIHLNGVILGGSYTDFYRVVDRDYNLGSGYSFRISPEFKWREKIALMLEWERIHLFTWKGYDESLNLSKLSHEEMLYLNAQGDKGNTQLNQFIAKTTFRLYQNWHLNLQYTQYFRHTKYAHFPDIKCIVSESKVGLTYFH